ncbi:MAG: VOC family protein [Pirellulales bacterium]|nr:VOC family protein [Pirellulales bacterium]
MKQQTIEAQSELYVSNLGGNRPTLFSVELRTQQWPTMVEWYRCVLGLRVLVRVVDDGYALLAAGDTRLALLQRPDADQSSRRWSLGFEVADLESIQARLIEAGTEIVKIKENPEGFRELVATDPDGNRIRLFVWSAGR